MNIPTILINFHLISYYLLPDVLTESYLLLSSKSGSSCPSLVYLVLLDLAPPLEEEDGFPFDMDA